MERRNPPYILVTSSGRTGTRFFGTTAHSMIENCVGVHEPDVLGSNRPDEWWRIVRRNGVRRTVFGRLSPRSCMRALSIARHRGTVSCDDAVSYIKEMRETLLREYPGRILLEANPQCNALVDLFPLAFPNIRIAFIIRDPRDWVRSYLNVSFTAYGRMDLRRYLPHGRLTPRLVPDDPYASKWRTMRQFEKLCWLWHRENEVSLAAVGRSNAARVYRYEDLFLNSDSHSAFAEFLSFVTQFPDGTAAQWRIREDLLQRRIHRFTDERCSHWTTWSDDHARVLQEHCGALMRELGYGLEPEWCNMVGVG